MGVGVPDYRAMVPRTPPEGMREWVQETCRSELDRHGLIYEAEYVEDYGLCQVLDEWAKPRKVKMVRVTCSCCGESVLLNWGYDTAIATTNLSAMFTELADNGSNVAGILQQQTGQSFSQLMDGGSNLGEIMAVLSDSVGGNATAFSNLWSSTTAGQAALSLLNSGADEFTRTLGVIETSSGAVEKNFQTMANTTEFAQQRMSNALQNLRIAIGDQLNPALEELYIFGTDALTWATDFVEDNPWVVGAISGLTAALGTLAVGVGALTTGPAIIKALSKALGMLAANPVLAVAVAVAGVVTAVEACTASTSEAGRQNKAFAKSLQETKDAYEDLKASMGQQQATTKATVSSLKELLAVEGKSAAQKEEILRKVDQLNEAVPGLGLAYDREKDQLIGLTEAEVDGALARAAAAEEHEAQMDRLNELSSQRVELEEQLAGARQKLTEAESEGGRGVDELLLIVDAYTAALEKNKAEYDELSESANAYAEHQGEVQRRQEAMTEKVDALTAEMAELQDAYDKSMVKARESLESQMGLFQELDGSAKRSIDDLISSLENQAKYMDDYAANIQKAMELGVDEGLIRKLSDGSEESAQILDAIVKGSKEDIDRLNGELRKVEQGKADFLQITQEMETGFSEKMDQLEGDLSETMKAMEADIPGKMEKVSLSLKGALSKLDVSKDMEAIGANNIQGLINGTLSKMGALTQKYTDAAKAAKDAYKKAVDQHSPSKEFEKMGRYDIQGAEEEKQRLAGTYAGVALEAMDSYARAAKRALDGLDLAAAYEESYAAAMKGVEGQLGLFQKVDGLAKNTPTDLIETLADQVWFLDRYTANLQKARDMGVDEDLVKKLSDGSEQSAQYLDAIVRGSAEDVETINELLSEVEEHKEKFSTTVAEMETDFDAQMEQMVQDLGQAIQELDMEPAAYAVGQNNIQGLIDGAASKRDALVAQYVEIARAAIEAYRQAVDQHSPSKEFEKMGRYDIQGLIQGAEKEKQRLADTYEEAAQAALAGMARHMATVTKEAPPQEDTVARQLEAISAATVNAISGIAQTGSAQPFTINLVFPDGTSFASYYFDPLAQYADANGTPILNPVR